MRTYNVGQRHIVKEHIAWFETFEGLTKVRIYMSDGTDIEWNLTNDLWNWLMFK